MNYINARHYNPHSTGLNNKTHRGFLVLKKVLSKKKNKPTPGRLLTEPSILCVPTADVQQDSVRTQYMLTLPGGTVWSSSNHSQLLQSGKVWGFLSSCLFFIYRKLQLSNNFQINCIYTGGTAAGIPLILLASIFYMHVNSPSSFLASFRHWSFLCRSSTRLTWLNIFIFLLCTATEIEITITKFTRNSMTASLLWFGQDRLTLPAFQEHRIVSHMIYTQYKGEESFQKRK